MIMENKQINCDPTYDDIISAYLTLTKLINSLPSQTPNIMQLNSNTQYIHVYI